MRGKRKIDLKNWPAQRTVVGRDSGTLHKRPDEQRKQVEPRAPGHGHVGCLGDCSLHNRPAVLVGGPTDSNGSTS